ncbi:hypothetical protein YA0089_27140 [Pseudomonas viridiflava]|uniref:hypothetical protein n=1 Tax=Pseudomonas viridiflava TaxID=33069 RepID=UPI0018E65DF8|nr:hypothetical protein [Pseudomonas viridiflava]MBI6727294.1 hypothetical protein [Pseudomonas viridiflava]
MRKIEITLADYRKTLKGMGYQVRTQRNSEFISAHVTHKESGEKVTGFNVMSPEFRNRHLAFFDYKNSVSIHEDGLDSMRVV